MLRKILLFGLAAIFSFLSLQAREIYANSAYRWTTDSVIQGEYSATAPSPYEIVSTYSAYPHYFMPIDKVWKLRNDISGYPHLSASSVLQQAIYNMGLDEMVNAVEPDTTLRTGKEWAGVWTRDVSYSIILSMAALQPQASMISLRHKVNANGRIIQDTGSGGAWPVSTDRMVWALAAWEIYKVTGDRKWLEYAYPIVKNSIGDDFKTVYAPSGLVRGETSFIDWREQSYPKWMQTADIYNSEAMNTNVVHAATLQILSEMAKALGKKKEAGEWQVRADRLKELINKEFYLNDKGYYGMYRYGRNHLIMNPRSETLGESLAILYDVASPEQALSITENMAVTPYGPGIFYPQIADMPSYHNNALWPFVASYWTLANAKAGNDEGTLQGFGSVVRPAALFATNKENFNLENGDIQTELNSSNMLWSLSGNLALTNRVLFGINFEPDGIRFSPAVPRALADTRTLSNFPYRGGRLNITVSGYGDKVASLTLNGKTLDPEKTVPASRLKGDCNIEIRLSDQPMASAKVNNRPNLKAPLTPIAWLERDPATGGTILQWNPIEYIGEYIVLRDGKEVGRTRSTSWPVTDGEWQVAGVSGEGVEGFASEPRMVGEIIAVQMPGESTAMTSAEISYPAVTPSTGWHGQGFVETDHRTGTLHVPVTVPQGGIYSLALRYANGNGPVNTENKCAIRTVEVNGVKAGTVVMPHRGTGNWYDWGLTNPVRVKLPAGESVITISFLPEDENMNLKTNHALIDEVVLTRMGAK